MPDLARRLAVARGDEPADLVIRAGQVFSVFTLEWLDGDLAIADGYVAGLGEYDGEETLDASGRYLVPGFIDAHMHLESSKLLVDEFARLVLPLGTTAVVADPHEIANVLGTDGVHWLADLCHDLPLDVFFMASSCVPASEFESPRRPLLPGDLEARTVEEGRERLQAGMWLLIREASGARNLHALLPLVEEFGPFRLAFCTDDREPEHIAEEGHVNSMVREAVAAGVTPEDALVMASFNPAQWHGLRDLGALGPGYQADIVVLPDLERFLPELVLKAGKPVEEIPRVEVPEWVKATVNVEPIAVNDFRVPWEGGKARVIGLVEGQIVTESLEEELRVDDGLAVPDPARDLLMIAVVERHLRTGRMGLGFVRGFGLQRGAMASTIAHDAHNIVVVGADEGDMARAVQRIAEIGGGIVVIESRGVQAELPLPVAGLLSDAPLAEVVEASRACVEAARELGCTYPSPFQTMAFL